ncbi:TVP38/TMEM64 family protein [Corynebacterium capitovis]|uniref:TVP38/TMEM64 family protein n=1 Tax=Corynebacterium capitovis TaxID=131081 RepID=UPI00036F8D88|nr:TVP38/TMEM64 family protein [Corynebacterium capitovis]
MQKSSIWRVIALIVVGVAFLVAWRSLEIPSLSSLRQWSAHAGEWFPLLFWMLYVLVTQFPVPRTLLTISAGVLFGGVWGAVLAITATTASAVVSLLVVRGLLRDWIAPRLTHPAVELVNRHLEQRGWLAVASLRMIAVVPFSIMNYTAALTRVPVLPFAAATFAGSLPGTVGTVFFGDTLTGTANPAVVALTVILALCGIGGLIADAALPTRSDTRASARVSSQGTGVDN